MSDVAESGTRNTQIALSRYEAHEVLRGHRPAVVTTDRGSSVVCACNLNTSGPFMWHIVDVLAEGLA